MKEPLPEIERALWSWIETQGLAKDAPKRSRHLMRSFYQFLCHAPGPEGRPILDSECRLDLTAIDKQTIADYQNELCERVSARTGKRLKVSSQTNRLVALKQFFHFARQTGRIAVDPTVVIVLPRKAQQVPASLLTLTEVRKLLNAPDVSTITGFRDRTAMELFWSTGMRVSEVVALNLTDIDAANRLVHIAHGKGGVERYVPVGPVVLDWIERYVRSVRPLHLKPYRPPVDALFISSYGVRWAKSALMTRIAHYRKELKLRKTVTSHSFRHTLATEMLRAGADLRHIQEMLGHENLTTTQRYLQVVKEDLKKVHRLSHPREKLAALRASGEKHGTGLPNVMNYRTS